VHQVGKDHTLHSMDHYRPHSSFDALHSMDHTLHSSGTQVPTSPTNHVRPDLPWNLVARAWGGRGIHRGSSPTEDLGRAAVYGGQRRSMVMVDCCCSWMRLLTCGGGLVVPEEAGFGRGRVYHPILYNGVVGGRHLGEGERHAAATVQW
jgi:hypothetical protein